VSVTRGVFPANQRYLACDVAEKRSASITENVGSLDFEKPRKDLEEVFKSMR